MTDKSQFNLFNCRNPIRNSTRDSTAGQTKFQGSNILFIFWTEPVYWMWRHYVPGVTDVDTIAIDMELVGLIKSTETIKRKGAPFSI